MLITLIVLTVILFLIGVFEKEKVNKVIFLALSTFLGYGAYKLSYDGTNYQYAYVPLAFAIVSIIYTFYVIYLMWQESINNNKDWGHEVDTTEL